jgi:hypothetical protein
MGLEKAGSEMAPGVLSYNLQHRIYRPGMTNMMEMPGRGVSQKPSGSRYKD